MGPCPGLLAVEKVPERLSGILTGPRLGLNVHVVLSQSIRDGSCITLDLLMQVLQSVISRLPTYFHDFFVGEVLKATVSIAHHCQRFITYVDVKVKLDYVTN